MSLKSKAFSSFNWTLVDGLFSQGFLFLVGIVLARILSPEEFGVIGLLTVFLAISNIVVEGGFGSALIRKSEVVPSDYDTVFYVNLWTSLGLYILVFLCSNTIAAFFEVEILGPILKVSGIVLVINALSLIHKTQFTKNLNFKDQAFVSVGAALVSGIIAIIMAYLGYGIWSLVGLTVIRPIVLCVLYWRINTWKPRINFSRDSFNDLFNFGYKLLLANIINTIYHNIFYILVGKIFSPASLGFYTRAEQFKTPISSNITTAIQRISFPILSKIKDDPDRLKSAFIKFIRFTMYINFPILIGLASIAKPLIIVLIGEKWSTSILYLQLLCIPGILYPLQILHLNLLLVTGHSNLNLKLEIIKKIVLVPIIVVTVNYGLIYMIWGLVGFSIIEFFINSYYTKNLIGYNGRRQLKDFAGFFLISLVMGISIWLLQFLPLDNLLILIFQLILGLLLYILLSLIFRFEEFNDVKGKVSSVLKKIRLSN